MTRATPLLILLATLLLLRCQPGERSVRPQNDALYGRWRLLTVQTGKAAPQPVTDRVFITFGRDGRLTYRRNDTDDGACCVPRRFTRQGNVVTTNHRADQPEVCARLDLLCTNAHASGSTRWYIEQLSSRTLTLRIDERVLTHVSAP